MDINGNESPDGDAPVREDWIFGGAGNDVLNGGAGNDTLYGGTGGNDVGSFSTLGLTMSIPPSLLIMATNPEMYMMAE